MVEGEGPLEENGQMRGKESQGTGEGASLGEEECLLYHFGLAVQGMLSARHSMKAVLL